MEYVFVYGTLMSGNSNNRFLSDAKFVTDATLENYGIYQVSHYFPAIAKKKNSCVVGEVYEVTGSDINKLDMLESEGVMYNRIVEKVRVKDDLYIDVYTYTVDKSKIYKNVDKQYKMLDGTKKWRSGNKIKITY